VANGKEKILEVAVSPATGEKIFDYDYTASIVERNSTYDFTGFEANLKSAAQENKPGRIYIYIGVGSEENPVSAATQTFSFYNAAYPDFIEDGDGDPYQGGGEIDNRILTKTLRLDVGELIANYGLSSANPLLSPERNLIFVEFQPGSGYQGVNIVNADTLPQGGLEVVLAKNSGSMYVQGPVNTNGYTPLIPPADPPANPPNNLAVMISLGGRIYLISRAMGNPAYYLYPTNPTTLDPAVTVPYIAPYDENTEFYMAMITPYAIKDPNYGDPYHLENWPPYNWSPPQWAKPRLRGGFIRLPSGFRAPVAHWVYTDAWGSVTRGAEYSSNVDPDDDDWGLFRPVDYNESVQPCSDTTSYKYDLNFQDYQIIPVEQQMQLNWWREINDFIKTPLVVEPPPPQWKEL
jgi:hypothetical protein